MTKSHLLLAVLGQVILSCLFHLVVDAGSFAEDEIFRRYRPLAMDESWEVVKNSGATNGGPPLPPLPPPPMVKMDSLPTAEPLPLMASGAIDDLDGGISDIARRDTGFLGPAPISDQVNKPWRPEPLPPLDSGLIDVEESGNVNVSENLFRIPKTETSTLTRLITGRDRPTLVHDQIITPVIENNPKSKILATYKILVPIYIPAVRSSKKVPVLVPPPVKYVKEVHTEMVPVKKNVSRVKNVIKAEKVPQQIITDYVKADGTSVPSSVDDKLKPNEKVLKSVVTNYD